MGSFFPDYADASRYPQVVAMWHRHLALPDQTLAKICYGNLANFLKENIL